MSYSLKQTRRFARAYKKLHDNVAADNARADELGLVFDSDPRHELPPPAPAVTTVSSESSAEVRNA